MGLSDTRPGVMTSNFDPQAGNVSDEDPHSYITQGANTRIYASVMLGFCIKAGSAYCSNNVETGYTSNDSKTIAAQAEDWKRRHFDGAIMTWQGAGTSEDGATLLLQSYLKQNDCDSQGCDFQYLIMYDGTSWNYNVASTGIPGTSGAGCSGKTGMVFENCAIAHLRNDMCYMNGTEWGNRAYLKSNGQPVVMNFPNESVIAATGPAPSWADVWANIQQWNEDLPGNCRIAPYNTDNGVPLFVFENDGGFKHQDSSGSYYWIEPAGTDPAADQLTLNISPVSLGGTLDHFLDTSLGYTDKMTWSDAFKGFNSSHANWGTGRIMDQGCGQTWIKSLSESNQYFPNSALPFLQITTWNDYDEGTEIESGIDNCFTVSGSTTGQKVYWQLNAISLSANLMTVSHIEIYDSLDGQNVSLVATLPAALSGNWDLSGLQNGAHTLFVRMVGKNSILNRISDGIPYSN